MASVWKTKVPSPSGSCSQERRQSGDHSAGQPISSWKLPATVAMMLLTFSVIQPVWVEKKKLTSASSSTTRGMLGPPAWAFRPKLTSHAPLRAALYSYSPAGRANVACHRSSSAS